MLTEQQRLYLEEVIKQEIASLSRPAQALLTLRPAGLLNRPKAAFVTRLRPTRLPDRAARQLPGPTDNSLGGTYLHW